LNGNIFRGENTLQNASQLASLNNLRIHASLRCLSASATARSPACKQAGWAVAGDAHRRLTALLRISLLFPINCDQNIPLAAHGTCAPARAFPRYAALPHTRALRRTAAFPAPSSQLTEPLAHLGSLYSAEGGGERAWHKRHARGMFLKAAASATLCRAWTLGRQTGQAMPQALKRLTSPVFTLSCSLMTAPVSYSNIGRTERLASFFSKQRKGGSAGQEDEEHYGHTPSHKAECRTVASPPRMPAFIIRRAAISCAP